MVYTAFFIGCIYMIKSILFEWSCEADSLTLLFDVTKIVTTGGVKT